LSLANDTAKRPLRALRLPLAVGGERGLLIALGWPMGHYFALLALPLLAAAVIVWRVRPPAGRD